jgi:hypothetical protein
MSEKEPQKAVGIPIWGIFLLFLGIVFLLQALGVLSWGLWGTLWRFWPVLIIIIGLGILLRRYNVWLISLLILAILGVCLGISMWQYEASSPGGAVIGSYSEPLGEIQSAEVEVEFNAGSLTVLSLPSGSSNLFEASSEVIDGTGGMRADFNRQGSEGRLYLTTERVDRGFWEEVGVRWEVKFARNAILTFNIRTAASNLSLDFSQLKVTELQLDIDAGNCTVRMPVPTGITHAYIDADAANVEVVIPEGVEARIRADADLCNLDIDESRFSKQGDYYISSDFYTSPNRIDLEINCDLGRVVVR